MTIIAARGLTRRFGRFTAVDEVDIHVGAGEVVGLLGANGAGKTTLIRMLLGLLTPTDGRIRLFGESLGREQRRRVGYVPQNLGLYRDLTVAENLEFRARSFGVVSKSADHVLGPDLIGEVPLGVQRQVAFEAAIQHGPELLILDEPTSGVSPLSRSRLWQLIRAQAEAGTAVLVSTHHMDEVEQADRLVVMADGRVVAHGQVDDIIGGKHIVEVTAADWAAAFAALDRDDRRINLSGRTVRVLGESPSAIEQVLDAAGIEAEIRQAAASLDEAMVELST